LRTSGDSLAVRNDTTALGTCPDDSSTGMITRLALATTLAAALTLAGATAAFSQETASITGTVIDASTGEAIIGGTVVVARAAR
jgi:hypothetical protein